MGVISELRQRGDLRPLRLSSHVIIIIIIIKVKFTQETGHEGPEGERMYSSTFLSTSALDGGGWSTARSGRFTPREKTRYPLYRRLCGPKGRSERVRKISPPTGIRSLDRPDRSDRYTDCAISTLIIIIIIA